MDRDVARGCVETGCARAKSTCAREAMLEERRCDAPTPIVGMDAEPVQPRLAARSERELGDGDDASILGRDP